VFSRTDKARSWLTRTEPETNEERVFQLLGLVWTHGDKDHIRGQAKKLLLTQHEDGGWSQLPGLQSDAYATGQALYALYQCGELKPRAGPYQKAIAFLLSTQFEDGSWKVESRSFPVIPFVYNGFPHEKNQFISAAGTNWATMALLLSLE
ncbi:MAG TPA: prenyltransferase/squalene oxidase repeat-containing protein, partial [Chitinophagaceae bacterium]|nr:prenyltransferase/squalene oxidase repeat-containing protein [Chitinophagaceae bacterium]